MPIFMEKANERSWNAAKHYLNTFIVLHFIGGL
jgi:hypothetical protein